jgi:hypothetical protein
MYELLLLTIVSQLDALFLLYAGPDQILPLVSILGTIIGFLLIWWRRFINLIRKAVGYFSKKPQPPATIEPSANLESAVTFESPAKD